ncbi:MAG: hypothetical protein IKC52_00255 [Clostridia bacterium]|nr:hypothetical protein [Clostridia bacterium]
MNCKNCQNQVNQEDYCICTKCKEHICPRCASQRSFVCDCGGDIAYLS